MLTRQLIAQIDAAGGFLPFERYMHEALFAPGVGYYSAGATKFGAAGDFVTAPEMSPLFAEALANQMKQVLDHSSEDILELGAGRGRLALDILKSFAQRGWALPHYRILEVSGDLRQRQQQLFDAEAPELGTHVEWLDAMPEVITGAVIANEVLDAVACQIFELDHDGWFEIGVGHHFGVLKEARLRLDAEPAALERIADILEPASLPYRVEVSPAAAALVATVAERLEKGAAFFIDYGFPDIEMYHPQRVGGTLMAHYRHHAHSDALLWPGLQDLTVHVDFTAMATAADDAGAFIYGYTSQARFLLNCGILAHLVDASGDALTQLRRTPGLQRLISEAEMGELFKVLAFGRGIEETLLGFKDGDRLGRL
jgi:SAM-dependent MidA family methyltransferase